MKRRGFFGRLLALPFVGKVPLPEVEVFEHKEVALGYQRYSGFDVINAGPDGTFAELISRTFQNHKDEFLASLTRNNYLLYMMGQTQPFQLELFRTDPAALPHYQDGRRYLIPYYGEEELAEDDEP